MSPDSLLRDHLANERTFLAWVRTAAAIAVLGATVAKFVENGSARAVAAGVILMVTGAAGVFYGSARYRRVSRDIESGWFEVGGRAGGPLVAVAVFVVAAAAAMLLLLL